MNASDTQNLGFDILMTMEVAVLLRESPGNYQLCGTAPYFYTRLFPQASDGSPCNSPWQYSPMLEFFLGEAEEFFKNSEPGASISSGVWVEELEGGDELPLLASARELPNTRLILIQAVREEYAERVRILRKARADILERRTLAGALNSSKKQAMYDPLTKLYERQAFLDILHRQIAALSAYAPNLALLMLGLDDFTKINDDFGRAGGDSVLSQLGDLMRRSLRKSDSPARYDSEKIAIAAPNTSFSQSLLVGEKLRRSVAQHDFGLGRPVTVSVGCTIYRPGEDLRELINRADAALSEARLAGQNTVRQRDPWNNFPPSFPVMSRFF